MESSYSKQKFLLSSEINDLRRGTPHCLNQIFFNNAGSSLIPKLSYESYLEYLNKEYELGGYATEEVYSRELKKVHYHLAKLIGAWDEEIALFENSSYAWQQAIYSIDLKEGDEIIFHSSEYSSNLFFLNKLKKEKKIILKKVKSNEYGEIDTDELERLINQKTKLVCLTHMPTGNGLVQPAEKVGEITSSKKVLYLLDACQSIGHYPIDVNKIQCDFLSASGRKYLRSVRGTGCLFVRKKVLAKLNPIFIDLKNMQWKGSSIEKNELNAKMFEFWESSKANQFALGESVKYTLDIGIHKIWEQIGFLSSYFRKKFHELPKFVPTDQGRIKSGIITFKHSRIATKDLYREIKKIAEVSMVTDEFTALSFEDRNISGGLIRASLHYYNTRQEIDSFFDELVKIESKLESSL